MTTFAPRTTTALVTGANRGIGAALVGALLDAGVPRVYAAMRTPQPARDERVTTVALDITDQAHVTRLAAELPDVNLLINNAGVSSGAALIGGDPAGAELEMRVNYYGMLAMSRAFAPVLANNGGGALVNMLSILARVNLPHVASYAASKAAAWSLTQALRGLLAPQGTLVIGVFPAFVDTDMARRVPFPKLAPKDLAASVIDALHAGTEDVYPGDAARIANDLQRDPKSVERAFARMFASRPAA